MDYETMKPRTRTCTGSECPENSRFSFELHGDAAGRGAADGHVEVNFLLNVNMRCHVSCHDATGLPHSVQRIAREIDGARWNKSNA
jgi:hypothetical protein